MRCSLHDGDSPERTPILRADIAVKSVGALGLNFIKGATCSTAA
jgi:hypothetical protein